LIDRLGIAGRVDPVESDSLLVVNQNEAKDALVDALVRDALAALGALEGQVLSRPSAEATISKGRASPMSRPRSEPWGV
jgi:hypothetical protein